MFEDKFYAKENEPWNTLGENEKTELLEHARYLTYAGSRWNNLLPVIYIVVGFPLLATVFILLPYLFIWESMAVVPVGVLVMHFVGNGIYQRINARLMSPVVSRLLAEKAAPKTT